ncbi:META domain-containing protein [Chloroflexota bacterium]
MVKTKHYLVLALTIISSLLVIGCGKATPADDFEDIAWVLESLGEPGNLTPVIEGTRITATFESDEGQVRGSAGCNSYFGGYELNGKLSIEMLAHTEMYCMEPEGVMDQEYQYLSTLNTAESYEIEDGKLRISCSEQVLVFTRETS